MIHAEYIKDLHSNYMVLKGTDGFKINYRVKVLLNNTIRGLLKTELRCIDTMDLFYYNITDKITLQSIYDNKSLKYEELKNFLESILQIIDRSSEYLLSEDDFIVDPNYIYYDSITQEIKLCYFVGHNQNLLSQLGNLIEFLMNKVDYKDEQAVVLIYALYKETKEPGCSYEKIIHLLNRKVEEELDIKQNTIQDEMLKQSKIENVNNKNINNSLSKNYNTKNSNIKNSNIKNNNIKNNNINNNNIKNNNIKNGNICNSNIMGIKKNNASILKDLYTKNNANRNNSTKIQSNINIHDKASSKCIKNKLDNVITKFKNKLRINFTNEQKSDYKKQIKNQQMNKQTSKLFRNKYKENHNFTSNNRMPFLEEIENDKEVYYYNPLIFILSGLSIVLAILAMVIAIHFKILYNSFGTRLDVLNTLCFILMIGLFEFYIQVRLFDKKNRNTKIMTEIEYIEPDMEEYHNEYNEPHIVYEDNENELLVEKTELLWSQDEEGEKTRILFSFTSNPKKAYELINIVDNSTVTIDTYPFVIGKMGSLVNMVINDSSVSRYHAKFTLNDEVLYLTDLGSTNGTFINNMRIQENKQYPISNMDEIKFSNVKYSIRKIVKEK